MEPVRSPRNQRVVDAARLRRARVRAEQGRTLIEGPHLLEDAVRFGIRVISVFSLDSDERAPKLAEAAGAELILVDERGLAKVADTESPRGPVAVIETPESVQATGSVVVMWELSDPGNAGTIIRTAAAFGFGVVSAGDGVDVWSPKVLRAAAGGHFATAVEVHAHITVDELRARGLRTVAAVGENGVGPERLPTGPVALLVGNEAHGLPPEIAQAADVQFTIPMPGGTESLNAATAASISLYALATRNVDPRQ